MLDRTTGRPLTITPFIKVTWGAIDAEGRVTVKNVPTPEGRVICPGPAGGKEWVHAAYSPRLSLFFIPVIEACATYTLRPMEFREGMPYWGGTASVSGHPHTGAVKAFDATGRELWSWKSAKPMVGSVLATAGELVFTGAPTGEFLAFDAKTGELLWQYQTGSGIHSSPIAYSVRGRQYIAVPVGWGGWIKGFAPDMIGAPRGDALFAFALPS